MIPATGPRPSQRTRLLAVDTASGDVLHRSIDALPDLLAPGDLVVVNDAATLPASLQARTASRGQPLELRLVAHAGGPRWRAALLGPGDWRTDTDHRPAPPAVAVGDALVLGGGLTARVTGLSPLSPRLVDVAFSPDGAALWRAIYRVGRPIQYAHLTRPVALWDVQTAYASRPWAVEMPSAGRPLSWQLLAALRRRGVATAAVTHAAGLSATGDAAIDAALPLPERYDIPAATVRAIEKARVHGGRVLAVGTTVVRAVEGRIVDRGALTAGSGVTDYRVEPTHQLRAIDAILTGMHAPTDSHYRLLGAFASTGQLDALSRHADTHGYRSHEFGDVALLAPRIVRAAAPLTCSGHASAHHG